MKKIYVLLIAMLISSASFAQKGGSNSNTDHLGEANGCVDARTSSSKSAYNQIMNNPSISAGYKESYHLAFFRCKSSSDWKIVSGKLVNTSKIFKIGKNTNKTTTFSGSTSFVKRLLGIK